MSEKVRAYFCGGIRKAVSVSAQRPYTLIVGFDDGAKRSVDMTGELFGVFEPLKDFEQFRKAHIASDGLIAWETPSGHLDIDKDNIYIHGKPIA